MSNQTTTIEITPSEDELFRACVVGNHMIQGVGMTPREALADLLRVWNMEQKDKAVGHE